MGIGLLIDLSGAKYRLIPFAGFWYFARFTIKNPAFFVKLIAFFLCRDVKVSSNKLFDIKDFVIDRITVPRSQKSYSLYAVVAFEPLENDLPDQRVSFEILGPDIESSKQEKTELPLAFHRHGAALGYGQISIRPRREGKHWVILYLNKKRVSSYSFLVSQS